jgi:peptidoglycan-associated lipoprotein
MNTARSASILAIAAMVAITGCAKKKPAVLPPPPPSTTGSSSDTGAGTGAGGYGNGIVPGSRADFLQQAGTDTIHFETNSSDVTGEATGILQSQARWLTAHANVRVTVEGHCDERGTREYNLALGERRANSAKNALVADGVSADRISVISYGKERPAAMGSDEASWAQNRRAVTVVPQ